MKFGAHNRKLLLVLGLLLAVSLLGASAHHHEGDEHCWYCTTAAAAFLPLVALALQVPQLSRRVGSSHETLLSWHIRRHLQSRGPPADC